MKPGTIPKGRLIPMGGLIKPFYLYSTEKVMALLCHDHWYERLIYSKRVHC